MGRNRGRVVETQRAMERKAWIETASRAGNPFRGNKRKHFRDALAHGLAWYRKTCHTACHSAASIVHVWTWEEPFASYSVTESAGGGTWKPGPWA